MGGTRASWPWCSFLVGWPCECVVAELKVATYSRPNALEWAVIRILQEFKEEVPTILHGNVRDIFYDPEERQHLLLPEFLSHLLARDKSLGFTMIGLWDQADGLPGMHDLLPGLLQSRHTSSQASQAIGSEAAGRATAGDPGHNGHHSLWWRALRTGRSVLDPRRGNSESRPIRDGLHRLPIRASPGIRRSLDSPAPGQYRSPGRGALRREAEDRR